MIRSRSRSLAQPRDVSRCSNAAESGRVSPIALGALLLLLGGLALWMMSWSHRPLSGASTPEPSPSPTAVTAPISASDTIGTDADVERALALARSTTGAVLTGGTIAAPGTIAAFDSAAYKSRWLGEVRGFDLSRLTSVRREIFLRFANAERCTCGCGYTLAGCRASDMSCDISGPKLEALYDSVATGRLRRAAGLRRAPTTPRAGPHPHLARPGRG